MFKSLRGQLILSHVLPSLVIIPLMGIALIYFLENNLILPNLQHQLADNAIVIAKLARSQPQIFSDPNLSQSLLENIELETATRLMILDKDGVLLASSDQSDAYRLNQALSSPGVEEASRGNLSEHLDFSQGLHGEVVDVFAPVSGSNGQVLGIIRLSYRFATVYDQLLEVRYLSVMILLAGIISSAALGFILALNIAHPIQQVTQAIVDLATGVRTDVLPEQGPEEIKTLQRAANHLVARLRELEQNRRQLLANLIHELGRPLGGLRMGIQVLRKGAKEDPQVLDELLEGMETETSILRNLLNDLSNLHDQVIGSLEMKQQPVVIGEWLPVVLRTYQEIAQRKGLHWEVAVPEELGSLKIDAERMAQVVGNLVNNAIKYTPRGGSVRITAGTGQESLWIRVSDTGPGIPAEEQKHIFEPFFRGTQKQRIKQGMGLGLSIARDVVGAHHGRLELDSTPGLGSHFTIWLPKV